MYTVLFNSSSTISDSLIDVQFRTIAEMKVASLEGTSIAKKFSLSTVTMSVRVAVLRFAAFQMSFSVITSAQREPSESSCKPDEEYTAKSLMRALSLKASSKAAVFFCGVSSAS